MDCDAHVGEVDEPEGLVEAEPGEEVPGCTVPECGIPEAPAHHVEQGRGRDSDQRRPLHHLVLRWARLQRILQFRCPKKREKKLNLAMK